MNHPLQWKKFPVLNDGFICLVDHMGNDYAIVQAARKSYDKDLQEAGLWQGATDRQTLRFMMRLGHTSPFEMVEIKFLVRVPMDCWRQWIRHRTANVNEYSTRYTEAIDSQQTTSPGEWRLQATDNKQGSSGFLPASNGGHVESWDGNSLTETEFEFHKEAQALYKQRLLAGIAKEQARKDLPLSTYTEAYWKCDLHNIFNFLRLRMDSHAQYEICMYANAMFEIVKSICPVACEAFEDYVLHAKKFSRMEMEMISNLLTISHNNIVPISERCEESKPASMTDREWKEFLNKLS
jgi:thymidylate synthase (FAD)